MFCIDEMFIYRLLGYSKDIQQDFSASSVFWSVTIILTVCNGPFYSCVLGVIVLYWKRGLGLPCFDTELDDVKFIGKQREKRNLHQTF